MTLLLMSRWVFGSSRIPDIISTNASSAPTVKATLQQQRAARRAALQVAANITEASGDSGANANGNTGESHGKDIPGL